MELNEIRYAEPDYVQGVDGGPAPNDANFGVQWALRNTGQTVNGKIATAGADERAVAAWGLTTGTNAVVVAVLDTGAVFASRSADQHVEQSGRNRRMPGRHSWLQRAEQRLRSDGRRHRL